MYRRFSKDTSDDCLVSTYFRAFVYYIHRYPRPLAGFKRQRRTGVVEKQNCIFVNAARARESILARRKRTDTMRSVIPCVIVRPHCTRTFMCIYIFYQNIKALGAIRFIRGVSSENRGEIAAAKLEFEENSP